MRYKIVSVRDRAADVFAQPVFVASIGGAVRAFGDEVKKEGTVINAHPEDYDLYVLGEFDDSTGEFISERPAQVAIGKDYV